MEEMDELMVRSHPVSSRKFMDGRVKNQHGEELGTIKELLVDPTTGQIVQLILETGSVIGFKKPIGLSWDMLSFDGDEILVNLEKDFIKAIPAYDETHEIEHR